MITNSNTYCILTDCGLSTQHNGGATICNQSRTNFQDTDGKHMTLLTHAIEDMWSGPTRQEIKKDLINGIKHTNCQSCWDEEAAGKKSMRMQYNEKYQGLEICEDQPRVMIIKPGNLCNLSCRHCSPHVSSQWIKESWKLEKSQLSYNEYAQQFRDYTESFREENPLWKTLSKWIPKFVYYDFYGAEPTLIEPMMNLLYESAEQGVADQQEVHLNTNGTIWKDSYPGMYSKFKGVRIGISIDAVGKQADYMRYPSNWETVFGNLKRYRDSMKQYKNIEIYVAITVSLLNIYYLDEIWQTLTNEGFNCNISFLHRPEHLNIRIAPATIKEKIKNKLINFTPTGLKQQDWHRQLEFILNFLNLEFDNSKKLFEEFQQITQNLDSSRNQSYRDVFPEFGDIIFLK